MFFLLVSTLVFGALALPHTTPRLQEISNSNNNDDQLPTPTAASSGIPPLQHTSNQSLPVKVPPPPPAALSTRGSGRQLGYDNYYIGPKLWYIPLFFSIYFLVYIIALILKAISRHKIQLPQLAGAASKISGRSEETSVLDELTARVSRALASAAITYIRYRH